MARVSPEEYRNGLVDLATGQISREICVNESLYRQELEQVFARACWLSTGQAPHSQLMDQIEAQWAKAPTTAD